MIEEPEVGRRYRTIPGVDRPMYVRVDDVVDVDVPPPDSFDAAHPDSWRRERMVYVGLLRNPIPIERFKADFEPIPDEDVPVERTEEPEATSPPITGQVFVRPTNRVVDGRKVVVLMAVVGVDDEFLLDGEAKYTIVGTGDGLMLRVLPETKDEEVDFKGWRIDQVLTAEHWRI